MPREAFVVGSGDSGLVCRFSGKSYYSGNIGPVAVGYGHHQTAGRWWLRLYVPVLTKSVKGLIECGEVLLQYMVVRPNLDEETVERLDKKLEDVTRVPPSKLGVDEKIHVLIEELEEREDLDEVHSNIQQEINNLYQEVRNMNVR